MSNMEFYTQRYTSPIGDLFITANSEALLRIDWNLEDFYPNPKEITELTISQLKEYFAGERKEFTIPLKMEGTDFQKSVWKSLQKVEYNETKSYKDIADLIDNPRAARAVGNANNKNPIPIIVPCHRVIHADGGLGGYGGGLDIKTFLLDLERDTQQKNPPKKTG